MASVAATYSPAQPATSNASLGGAKTVQIKMKVANRFGKTKTRWDTPKMGARGTVVTASRNPFEKGGVAANPGNSQSAGQSGNQIETKTAEK